MLNELQAKLHKESTAAGWWKPHAPRFSEVKAYEIALMHLKLSEYLDVIRKGGNPDGEDILDDLRQIMLTEPSAYKELPEEQIILGTKLALIHSEVSEAFDGLQTGAMDKHLPHRKEVEVEIADALIRVLDFAGKMGVDLEATIREKQEYNKARADHKPENRSKSDGKQF